MKQPLPRKTLRIVGLWLAAILCMVAFAACGTGSTNDSPSDTLGGMLTSSEQADASTDLATVPPTAADTESSPAWGTEDDTNTPATSETAVPSITPLESDSASEPTTEAPPANETAPVETDPVEVPEKTYYIALGDSIAKGYAVDLKTVTYDADGQRQVTFSADYYTDDGNPDFVPDTYTAALRDRLIADGTVDAAFNFARSGDTCQDLIDFLAEISDSDPDAPSARFPARTNREVLTALENARVITVCIGANNVLVPAIDLLPKYIAGEIPYNVLEATTRIHLLGAGTPGVEGYKKGLADEIPELLARLHAVSPEAEIVFSTIYNPYRKLDVGEGLRFLEMIGSVANAEEKLNSVESLSELAIAGGADASGNDLVGINPILREALATFTAETGRTIHLADTKTLFDAAAADSDYCDLVNTDMGYLTVKDAGNYTTYADPHPTHAGHALMLRAHESILDTMEFD